MHTGENTRCRKSVNLTIIIILLGTLMLKKKPLTRKLSSKRGKILRAYMYEERYNIYMQISKVFFGGVINHQFLLLLIRFASVCTNCNINSGNTIVIFGLYCCLARVIVIYTGRDMLRTPSSYRDLYSLALTTCYRSGVCSSIVGQVNAPPQNKLTLSQRNATTVRDFEGR